MQGNGVGVLPQLTWATWLATALLQMDSHWEPSNEAVMTLELVKRPPEAVMSWLIVTLVLARPW